VYVNVLLPLALNNLFTYSVPAEWQSYVGFGKRVVVNFGKNKLYTALVISSSDENNSGFDAKELVSVIDEAAVITPAQYLSWQWIATYYMCYLGDVMNAALPSGLKLNSETTFVLTPDVDIDKTLLNDSEYLLVEALEVRHFLTIDEINAVLNNKKTHSTVKRLVDKNIIQIKEELKLRYKPKYATFIQLSKQYSSNTIAFEALFDELKRAVKQQQALTAYVSLSNYYTNAPNYLVPKKLLEERASCDAAALKALEKKGVFEFIEIEVSRLNNKATNVNQTMVLTAIQQEALDKVKTELTTHDVCLLHGVTGSGKTNIYAQLISETLAQGKQVVYLVPEIALTTQLVSRLKKILNVPIGVYHSRFNENERVEVWNNLLHKKGAQVILGARSSILLPYDNLGLIIVDEEHDPSYKQQDPAPRYNARDTAIMIAKQYNAKIVLGSATPAIETYYNIQQKKYGYVALLQRYNNVKMPVIELVDIKKNLLQRSMKASLTRELHALMTEALSNKKQIILFQNRRGYVPMHECMTCGHIPQCVQCDVSLTYHKQINLLKCHYCGYSIAPQPRCAKCNSTNIITKGIGTQKIEEDVQLLFPDARVARMDTDTTRGKLAFETLIQQLENKEIDILIGTQMVTKGLDFSSVDLVGIINADETLHYPDFRASERAFSLFSQVSGRAGRESGLGKIIIQTMQPQHTILEFVKENDYFNYFELELRERKMYGYPPFTRIIELTLQHRDINILNEYCHVLSIDLQKAFGKRCLGPEFPTPARIKNIYNKRFIIKIERGGNIASAKKMLQQMLDSMYKHNRLVRVVIDVDVNS
jgi:primosomal protein N' (replication factor Y) (superfamily II helicase)